MSLSYPTVTLEASRDQTSLSIDEPSRIEDQPSTSATPAPPTPAHIPMSRRSSSSDGGDYGGDLFAADYDDDYDIPSVAPQSVGPQAVEEPEEEEEVRRSIPLLSFIHFIFISSFPTKYNV